MPLIRFEIDGDPVPYLRMTQGQVRLMRIPDKRISAYGLKVKNRIRRYLDYKERVRLLSCRLPIDRNPKTKVFLNVTVYFSTRRHGDPENIRKGIQDAIFEQDKMVAGAVDFFYDSDRPRAEVEITVGEP